MKDLLLPLLHLAVTAAKLCRPGGVRAVIAENLLLKQQLIVLRRSLQRAPNLSVSNSSSGRRWKLDHAPAVGDPTHMVEFGTGRRAFAREA